MITLKTTNRTKEQKILPGDDIISCVMYGNQIPSTSISISRIDFTRAYKEAGTATLITLDTEEGMKTAIIHDIQLTPATHKISHVDFYLIDAKHTIKVSIPVNFHGVAPAEKDGLGNLLKPVQEVEVECLPSDLPSHFDVSLETLVTLDDNICVSDIKLPKGVTLITDGEVVLATVSFMQEEAEETTPIDLESIQVEKKGKKEEKE